MSENRNEEKVDITYMIHIECEVFPKEVVELLKRNNIKFDIWKNHNLKQSQEEIDEEIPFVELNPDLYQKLKRISEITEIPLKELVNDPLSHHINDFISSEPYIFLDIHIGIENVKDPIGIIEKLKDIIPYSESDIEHFKSFDPVKYIKDWGLSFRNVVYNHPEEVNTKDTITLSISRELYSKAEELCKINNWNTNDKLIEIIENAINSAEITEENGVKQLTNF